MHASLRRNWLCLFFFPWWRRTFLEWDNYVSSKCLPNCEIITFCLLRNLSNVSFIDSKDIGRAESLLTASAKVQPIKIIHWNNSDHTFLQNFSTYEFAQVLILSYYTFSYFLSCSMKATYRSFWRRETLPTIFKPNVPVANIGYYG